jgi:hypothetical protein
VRVSPLGHTHKVSELLCPTCDAPVVERIVAYEDRDPNQADINAFACGYVRGGYYPQACPHDPGFPALTDYELRSEAAQPDIWLCFVATKTAAAKRHYLGHAEGSTATEAKIALSRSITAEPYLVPACAGHLAGVEASAPSRARARFIVCPQGGG